MTSPMPEAKPGRHEPPPGLCTATAMFHAARSGLICVRQPGHGQHTHKDPVYGEWMLAMVPSAVAADSASLLAACPGEQQQILDLVRRLPGMTAREITLESGVYPGMGTSLAAAKVRKDLEALESCGKVSRRRENGAWHWRAAE